MNCTEFEHAVQTRWDERQWALTPGLRAHADECAGCREQWQARQCLLSALAACQTPVAPNGLVDAVLRECRRPVQTIRDQALSCPPTRVPRGGLWAAACSAAALFGLVLALAQQSTLEPVSPRESLARRTAPVPDTPLTDDSADGVVSQSLAGLWLGVHSEYQVLSTSSLGSLPAWPDLSLGSELLPPLATPASPNDAPAPPSGSSWLRLDRPVSERAVQAFDFLWDALPHDAARSS